MRDSRQINLLDPKTVRKHAERDWEGRLCTKPGPVHTKISAEHFCFIQLGLDVGQPTARPRTRKECVHPPDAERMPLGLKSRPKHAKEH
jgi:hypothetical protein